MAKKIKDGNIKINSICSKCSSTQGYLRLKTMERVCRSCGNIDKIEVKNHD